MVHFQQQEKERWKEIRRKRREGGGGGVVDKNIPCNSSEYLNRIILSQKLFDLLYSRINCTS